MVDIGHVRMRVSPRLMKTPVAVLAGWRHVAHVIVMVVVVVVRVLVAERIVRVLVAMRFGQVQHHTGEHQGTARCSHQAGGTVPERDRQRRADERDEREHRSRARCA